MKTNTVVHCDCGQRLRITRVATGRTRGRNVDLDLEINVKPCRFCSRAKTDAELDRDMEKLHKKRKAKS